MAQGTTFGRRAAAAAPQTVRPPAPVKDLPTLKDLGFTPADDSAELQDFKRAYRKRRFSWRWVGGVCFLASAIAGLFDLDAISAVLGTAGALAIGHSILRPFLPDRAP